MTDNKEDDFVGVYDLLDALRAVLVTADPQKRAMLAKALDGFSRTYFEEYFWAIGPKSPMLLYHFMMEIEHSCRPTPAPPARATERPPANSVIQLVDRKLKKGTG